MESTTPHIIFLKGLLKKNNEKKSQWIKINFLIFNLQKMAKKFLIERICVFSKLCSVKILPNSLKIALNNQQKYCFRNQTGGFSPVKLGTLSWPLIFHHQNLNFRTNSVSKFDMH